MSDFWKDYEPEPTKPAPMTKDELTEPLGCVVVRPLVANSTTPPAAQRQWVGLTNDEVNEFAAGCHLGNSVQGAIYKAEAKLKEKNT
jgi:hypothetical protein